jgi:uncharacterized protein YjhX (UPF0386 family)
LAKLSDLVNVNINRDTIKIQGVDIPVIFTMKSFPFVEEAYGKPYHIFEKDLNRMLQKGNIRLGKNEIKLMSALIYAMVRSGGTECTPKELEGSIPISDLSGVFQTVLNIFNNQMFQKEDMDKMKTEKKN